MTAYPLQRILAATLAIVISALAASSASADVLLEVDLSVENELTVRSTAGNSLRTQTIQSSDNIIGLIPFWGVSLRDFQANGARLDPGQLASGPRLSGDFDFAQSPGDAFATFLQAASDDTGVSLQYGFGSHTVVEGSRAFTGTRTVQLDPQDYQTMINDLVQRNTAKDVVFHGGTAPDGTEAPIGQYQVTDAPGFAGAAVELKIETIVEPGDAFATDGFDAVMGSDIEFDRDRTGFKFLNPLNGQSGFRFTEPVDIDLGVNTISISGYGGEFTFGGDADFNGYVLRDTADNIAPFLGVSIDPSTNTNFPTENIEVFENEIRIDVDGITVDPNTEILLNVLFEGDVLAGDFDADGNVDGRDFLAWQQGISPEPLSQSDLADWQNAYGQSVISATVGNPVAGGSGLIAAVPEPTCCGLISIAVCLLGSCRRYAQQRMGAAVTSN